MQHKDKKNTNPVHLGGQGEKKCYFFPILGTNWFQKSEFFVGQKKMGKKTKIGKKLVLGNLVRKCRIPIREKCFPSEVPGKEYTHTKSIKKCKFCWNTKQNKLKTQKKCLFWVWVVLGRQIHLTPSIHQNCLVGVHPEHWKWGTPLRQTGGALPVYASDTLPLKLDPDPALWLLEGSHLFGGPEKCCSLSGGEVVPGRGQDKTLPLGGLCQLPGCEEVNPMRNVFHSWHTNPWEILLKSATTSASFVADGKPETYKRSLGSVAISGHEAERGGEEWASKRVNKLCAHMDGPLIASRKVCHTTQMFSMHQSNTAKQSNWEKVLISSVWHVKKKFFLNGLHNESWQGQQGACGVQHRQTTRTQVLLRASPFSFLEDPRISSMFNRFKLLRFRIWFSSALEIKRKIWSSTEYEAVAKIWRYAAIWRPFTRIREQRCSLADLWRPMDGVTSTLGFA